MRDVGRLCVGIDPHPSTTASWDFPDTTEGLREFSLRMVEAASGLVPIVKPQSAFFERHGSAGAAVLEELCRAASAAGLLVLLDAKRGDIGSTNAAYADAYLRQSSPIPVDAITITPFTGFGALEPLLSVAQAEGSGVFVLLRTSNVEGLGIQSAVMADGRDISTRILDDIALANATTGTAMGSVGAVFGATMDTDEFKLDAMRGPILAPGLGAQGASPDDIARRFAQCRDLVLPTASRSISSAGPDISSIRRAIADLNNACTEALR
jgi:orotidine-5'-phosphate decarboxylase